MIEKYKRKDAKHNGRLTQHKRFVPDGTHPNPAVGGTSFMLEPLYQTPNCRKNQLSDSHLVFGFGKSKATNSADKIGRENLPLQKIL